jgi:type IV pilus assembly protein PilM
VSFLHKKIFTVDPRPFGLDLSDLSLKAVRIEREGKVDRVAGYGSVGLPPGAVSDGEIADEAAVAAAVRSLLEKTGSRGFRARQVVCSLPEVKAFLRIIHMPPLEASEVGEAIKWEIEANIPLALDQVYYDWQVLGRRLGREKDGISVLVVAVARSVVDQFVAVLEASGLEPVGLETESVAQARSLLRAAEKGSVEGETTLVVDIGDRRTSFLAAIDGMPCFTSSIPLSSQGMTDAIAKSLRVSLEEAEAMKISLGIGSSLKKDPLFRAVEPVLENLAVEIERSIDFYLSGLRYSASVDRVVFCGGGSLAKGLLPYLSRRLHRPLEPGDPWTNVRLGRRLPPIDRDASLRYSTAIGLALSSLDDYEYQA